VTSALTCDGLHAVLDLVVGLGHLEDAAALLVRRPGAAVAEVAEDGVADLQFDQKYYFFL
jgi:hypothetical protein